MKIWRNQHKKYKVYVLIFPNGKYYFGITSRKTNIRWKNGTGYSSEKQPVVYNAIQKYGWNNIQKKILFYDLTYEEANDMEMCLIKKYKTNCKRYGNDYGYNMTDGGDGTKGHIVSDEQKRRVSEFFKGRTGEKCPNSKTVITNTEKFTSLTQFCNKYGLKHQTVSTWLTGKKKMPIEWYNKGLRYKDGDNNKIVPQTVPHKKKVFYDGKIYSSLAELSREISVGSPLLCRWINNINKMPKEYKDKNLHYVE